MSLIALWCKRSAAHPNLNLQIISLLLLAVIACMPVPLFSQDNPSNPSMKVVSITEAENDLTAITEGTQLIDQNGDRCALLKIKTTQKGFAIDAGQLGVVKTEEQNASHPAEIWVYLPPGVMTLTIQHPHFGSLSDIDLGRRVKKGKTYVMELTTNEVNTLVFDYNHLQTVDINIHPSEASLFINGSPHSLDINGNYTIKLPFGKHKYRVTAPRYHIAQGEINLNDSVNHFPLNIRLRPTFGFLDINSSSDSHGAQVYIDNVLVGSLPAYKLEVASGKHTLTISRPLYLPYSETITMTDSATLTINPTFSPNFAKYELSAGNDREVQLYDGDTFLASGRWEGRLEAGEHRLSARKPNHAPSDTTIIVKKGENKSLVHTPPKPLYGILNLSTQPDNARIIIDGKSVGTSNLLNHRLLMGKHTVEISKSGCRPEKLDIRIGQDSITSLNIPLKGYCTATLRSNPVGAEVYIDGRYAGQTPLPLNKEAGKYNILIQAKDYSPYQKRLTLDGNTEDISIKLQRNFINQNEFYIQAGFRAPGLMAINIGAGLYWHNINLEANYLKCLGDSGSIYWNNTTQGEFTPMEAIYTPSAFDIKAGYGIKLHPRMRLTPQIGCRFVTLAEELIDTSSTGGAHASYLYSSIAGKPSAASLSVGIRFNLALTKWLGLSVTPEYLIGVSRSEGYKALSEASSTIKNYAEGFSGNISLNIFF